MRGEGVVGRGGAWRRDACRSGPRSVRAEQLLQAEDRRRGDLAPGANLEELAEADRRRNRCQIARRERADRVLRGCVAAGVRGERAVKKRGAGRFSGRAARRGTGGSSLGPAIFSPTSPASPRAPASRRRQTRRPPAELAHGLARRSRQIRWRRERTGLLSPHQSQSATIAPRTSHAFRSVHWRPSRTSVPTAASCRASLWIVIACS